MKGVQNKLTYISKLTNVFCSLFLAWKYQLKK
jgi:hypothetical protein